MTAACHGNFVSLKSCRPGEEVATRLVKDIGKQLSMQERLPSCKRIAYLNDRHDRTSRRKVLKEVFNLFARVKISIRFFV